MFEGALEWCLSYLGDVEVGIYLAASLARLGGVEEAKGTIADLVERA
jgi:hypothetical protein